MSVVSLVGVIFLFPGMNANVSRSRLCVFPLLWALYARSRPGFFHPRTMREATANGIPPVSSDRLRILVPKEETHPEKGLKLSSIPFKLFRFLMDRLPCY